MFKSIPRVMSSAAGGKFPSDPLAVLTSVVRVGVDVMVGRGRPPAWRGVVPTGDTVPMALDVFWLVGLVLEMGVVCGGWGMGWMACSWDI